MISPGEPATMYLDLLKGVLTRELFMDHEVLRPVRPGNWTRHVLVPIQWALGRRGLQIAAGAGTGRKIPTNFAELKAIRESGLDWPANAETMIGRRRLDSLHDSVQTVVDEKIPGDLIETGVWRGGAVILMRAVLKVNGVTDRTVWAADSFEGLPAATLDIDRTHDLSGYGQLAIDLSTVKSNFERYGLLDDQVRFLVGWFKDSLRNAPLEQLALVRLDGDYYESTWDAISVLYPILSPGGILIVDDYGVVDGCRKAVDDYRQQMKISEEIEWIDQSGIRWRKN